MYSFCYLEPVCCSMSSSNCCFLACIQVSQEAGQVVWYSHLKYITLYLFEYWYILLLSCKNPLFFWIQSLHYVCTFFIDVIFKIHYFNLFKETRFKRDTCIPMFIAALFIIARTWRQPRCPSADEWIRKLWYIYTMEYYSAIKKNSFESVLMRWRKLEPIIQSEVSQKDKEHYSILTHIYGI